MANDGCVEGHVDCVCEGPGVDLLGVKAGASARAFRVRIFPLDP